MTVNKLPLNEIHIASIVLYLSAQRDTDKELRKFKFNTVFKLRRFIIKNGFPNTLGTIRPILSKRVCKGEYRPVESACEDVCSKPKPKVSSLKKRNMTR